MSPLLEGSKLFLALQEELKVRSQNVNTLVISTRHEEYLDVKTLGFEPTCDTFFAA